MSTSTLLRPTEAFVAESVREAPQGNEAPLAMLVIGAFSPPTLGTRGISEDVCARLASAGWRTKCVSHRSGRGARLLEMLWSCWADRHFYQVAAVDVYSGPAFLWAQTVCWFLRRIGKPYVLMLHGGHLPDFAARYPARVRRLLASAAAVTAPSEYLKHGMQPYCNHIKLLPNALHVDAYSFRIRKQVTRMVWLRAFHEVYNPVMAVRVLARVRRELPQIHLTMIGPDKGDGSLEKTKLEASRLGLLDCVQFLGSVPKEDVPAHLAAADVFLNTARIDNTPVSVLEALASGLCVVSTDVGGIPYLVQAERNALLVSSDDAQGMAEAVRRIIVNTSLSQALSANARRRAEQFDWSVILPLWKQLFTSVARPGNPPLTARNQLEATETVQKV